jgi:hypothetical protein
LAASTWNILFVALLAAVVVGLALTHVIHRAIELGDPDLFDALGRPHLFKNNTISNGLKFQRWVFSLGFRKSRHGRIRNLGWVLLVYQLLYLGFFCSLLAFGANACAA